MEQPSLIKRILAAAANCHPRFIALPDTTTVVAGILFLAVFAALTQRDIAIRGRLSAEKSRDSLSVELKELRSLARSYNKSAIARDSIITEYGSRFFKRHAVSPDETDTLMLLGDSIIKECKERRAIIRKIGY